MGLPGRLAKAGLYTLLVPGTICGLVPWAIQRWGSPPVLDPAPTATTGGWVLIALGGLLYLWCTIDFLARGEGTPNPLDPPRRLVVGGPYRVVRNPMYLGVLLLLLGQALRWPSPAMLGLLGGSVLFVLGMVLGYEERALARAFGADYDRYRAKTPRFLPWLRRRQRAGPGSSPALDDGAHER